VTRIIESRSVQEQDDGGYDDLYRASPCAWGRQPGSLIIQAENWLIGWSGLAVLDLGCGEGKNAAYVDAKGASVHAMDISDVALHNARHAWPDSTAIKWELADVRTVNLDPLRYDVVVMYGLLHCFQNNSEVVKTVEKAKHATVPGGLHLVCAFNDRYQELHAHPNLSPFLMSHCDILGLYSNWDILHASDADLHESHSTNGIMHTHSLTRIVAKAPV
jgi:tellurite methyltransferase